ncbi:MAG: hypothetical protein WCG25_06930 [bacterium]
MLSELFVVHLNLTLKLLLRYAHGILADNGIATHEFALLLGL